MDKRTITKVFMDNGKEVDLNYPPDEVLKKFTENGKIVDKFLEFGECYINPKHDEVYPKY